MPKVVHGHPQHCPRTPPSIMLEVVSVHLQHYARSCPPASQSGLAIVGGAVTSWRLARGSVERRRFGRKKGELERMGKEG